MGRREDGLWQSLQRLSQTHGSSGVEIAFRVVPSWSKMAEPLDSYLDQSPGRGSGIGRGSVFNCEWLLERNSAESHKQPALQAAGG